MPSRTGVAAGVRPSQPSQEQSCRFSSTVVTVVTYSIHGLQICKQPWVTEAFQTPNIQNIEAAYGTGWSIITHKEAGSDPSFSYHKHQ